VTSIILNNPLISVIIPTFNHGDYIEKAIDSVLQQSYKELEIIVVDDGSTDNTAGIILKYGERIKYIRQRNGGGNAARNRGIRESRGELLAFLDADDYWIQDKLAKQIPEIIREESVGIVGCGYFVIDVAGNIIKGPVIRSNYRTREELYNALTTGQIIPASASGALIRKQCFRDVGEFDETLKMGQEWDMWLRLTKIYHASFIQEPLVCIRFGSSVVKRQDITVKGSALTGPKKEEYYVKLIIEKNVPKEKQRRAFSSLFYRLASDYLSLGNRMEAMKYLLKSVYLRPLCLFPRDKTGTYNYPKDLRYYLILKSMIPVYVIKKIKEWHDIEKR